MQFADKIFALFKGSPGTHYDWHDNWHEDFITHLARITKPAVYVELGLYRCKLFNKMIPVADRLIGVDNDPSVVRYMKKSGKTTFFNMKTDEFAEKLREEPLAIDMIFIDADHSENAVRDDFFHFLPFVRPHGLLILHDTHPRSDLFIQKEFCGDGYKAMEAISRNAKDYEVLTIPVHPGLTIVRKRNTQLSWQENQAS